MTRTELENASPGDSIILPWAEGEYPLAEAGEWVHGNWRRLSWRTGVGVDGAYVAVNGPEILGKLRE